MRRFFILLLLPLLFASKNISAVANKNFILSCLGEERCYDLTDKITYLKGVPFIENIDELVSDIAKSEQRRTADAKFYITKNYDQPIKLVDEIFGREVNEEKLKQDIIDALSVGGGEIKLEYFYQAPAITKSDLSKKLLKRGEFYTCFSDNKDRTQNIKLASNSLNAIKIGAGEVLSFNKVVGERTKERGYKMAKIILNGEFVEGVGGGVCQVSSTLYNIALLSGLEVVEHHRHSLNVSYVEPSFDAMVNSSTSDLKIKNTTSSPVYIFSKVSNNKIYFSVYGEENLYSYKRQSVVTEEIIPKMNVIETTELALGESEVLIESKKGCKSEGYLLKYYQGELVEKNKIRSDIYQSVNGVIKVGTRGNYEN